MDAPEGQQPSITDVYEDSRQESTNGFKAHMFEKIRNVADDEKRKMLYEKQAATAFVKSDPLGIYAKEDVAETLSRGQSQAFSRQPSCPSPEKVERAPADEQKPKRAIMKRKKKEDDIFKSFGKEHDQQAVQTVDGKLKVNYKRFWNSETDLGRWKQGLATNTRHCHLFLESKERSMGSDDFGDLQMRLRTQHNGLFRQRYGVNPQELAKKPQVAAQMRELQKRMAPDAPNGRKGAPGNDLASVFRSPMDGRPGSSTEHDQPIQRSYGEEQVLEFLTAALTRNDNLENTFRKFDTNGTRELAFGEFLDGANRIGFRGDPKFLFSKLNQNGDGCLKMAEFMQLKPYMLKEMVRVLVASRNAPEAAMRGNVWLKIARMELAQDQALKEALDQEQSYSSKVPKKREHSKERPDTADSRSSGCSLVQESTIGSTIGSVGRVVPPAMGEEMGGPATWERLPQVQELPKTMSLFIFRNADRTSTGEAIFIGKIRRDATIAHLLEVCSKTVKPLVGPPDCLIDLNLNPVRYIHQVQNGGTYLLKGKETLDPPPIFFLPRPPLGSDVRYKKVCNMQMACQCEAESRPNTSSTRPNTTASIMSGPASQFGSVMTDASGSQGGFGSLFAPPSAPSYAEATPYTPPLPMSHTWQAPVRLSKHLTYGGKNPAPVHKRYDLWTAMPRAISESSIDPFASNSVWSTASAPY